MTNYTQTTAAHQLMFHFSNVLIRSWSSILPLPHSMCLATSPTSGAWGLNASIWPLHGRSKGHNMTVHLLSRIKTSSEFRGWVSSGSSYFSCLPMIWRHTPEPSLNGLNVLMQDLTPRQVCGRSGLTHTEMASISPLFFIYLDTFLHGVHILPVFGRDLLPSDFHFLYSLDAFETYYINKYADHHAHEICS